MEASLPVESVHKHRRLHRVTRGSRSVGGTLRAALVCACVAGCTEPTLVLSYGDAGTTTLAVGSEATASDSGSPDDGLDDGLDESSQGTGISMCDADGICTNKIDLLFVIDNSGTMGEEQLNLAKNFPLLIEQLEALEDGAGNPVGTDVNVMITTTDFGNPQCSGQWVHEGYEAAAGRPIRTPCTERLDRFEGFGSPPPVVTEACTDVCDPRNPAFPTDQFIHFTATEDNVVGGTPADALACVGPQGIDGCGFEGTLESMAQALDPSACWNDPAGCEDPEFDDIERPFLRDDAVLAIAIITDEADCSVQQFSIMESETFMAEDPTTMQPGLSSALCWNAGVVCAELDPMTGLYAGCLAADKDTSGGVSVPPGGQTALQPLARYSQLFEVFKAQGKEVIMLGVLGVPEVTERSDTPPFEPVAGGVFDLEFRDWREEDVLPDEAMSGVVAADKQFEFGIGPGCTGIGSDGSYTGQAVAPVRIREVCESLNIADDPETEADETTIRCCIESICDEDFSPAIRCLTGLIQDVFQPVG